LKVGIFFGSICFTVQTEKVFFGWVDFLPS